MSVRVYVLSNALVRWTEKVENKRGGQMQKDEKVGESVFHASMYRNKYSLAVYYRVHTADHEWWLSLVRTISGCHPNNEKLSRNVAGSFLWPLDT